MSRVERWRFSALEFRVLWESTGRDVLPYPLRHRSMAHYRDEFVAQWRAAARTVAPQLDDALVRAIQVLLAPEARIEVAGFRGANGERRIRAHAGVHYQHAAIAVQEPEDNGDVHLALLPADRIASAVLAALPKCGAGQGKSLTIAIDELERPLPVARDPWRPTPRQEFERFFDRPTSCRCHVAVYPHGSVDNRHIQGRRDFQLSDFTGDGRYLSYGLRTVTVRPADATRLTAAIDQLIVQTVAEVRAGGHPGL
ncbi:ESX secretion-associated protein EspG [Nocardia panacis]|uniref:ESX secretion-associated protein EspG n=1 Tax=Nocardia panacis TaxID=2340916 RepID=A0A3A4L7G0_9NOCA|nr:ESX secretion-associated protein EspG [Nocardia panacis]RJO78822.1 ESX secretion-associated protein EspG [Nocardia panacis]